MNFDFIYCNYVATSAAGLQLLARSYWLRLFPGPNPKPSHYTLNVHLLSLWQMANPTLNQLCCFSIVRHNKDKVLKENLRGPSGSFYSYLYIHILYLDASPLNWTWPKLWLLNVTWSLITCSQLVDLEAEGDNDVTQKLHFMLDYICQILKLVWRPKK